MTLPEILRSVGIEPAYLVAGGAGGLLRALTRKKFKLREIFLAPICGILASVYLTVPVVQYLQIAGWPIPDNDAHVLLASAFIVGNCAMWISDVVFEVIVRRIKPSA